MTRDVFYQLNSSFAGVNTLQAQGSIVTGNLSPAGIGDSLTITNGVMKSRITQSDTPTATGIRAEITAPADAYAERWYVWEFMIPADFAPTTDPITLMQIHDTPDGGDGAKRIPFNIDYMQSGLLGAYVPLQTLPTEGNNGTIAGLMEFERGVWNTACLRAKWATDATGFREFYFNRRPVFRHYNLPTMYSDVVGPYFKCGCYDGTHNARFGTAEAYYRNVAVWSGNDGYPTVMGGQILPKQFVE